MDAASSKLADLDSLSVEQLKALLREQHTKLQEQQTTLQEQHAALEEKHAQLVAQDALLRSYTIEIQSLKLQIFKLRKMQYGTSSEKRALEIKQLELWVQELEEAVSQRSSELAEQVGLPPSIPKKRREFPAHLARETQTIAPLQSSCPDCGGELKHLGEDVSEMLELEPVRFKVIRYVRPKLACAGCDTIVQAPAPTRTIDRGMAGPGLLAHLLVSKYSDHVPLYRQAQIYAREGIELDRTLLAQWVGSVSAQLTPLTEALRAHVLAADVVHADDTPVPVLAPGNGKTKTGRLWTYVRDERPAAGIGAPAVWFAYSADRKGEHPQRHLQDFDGILQADGYGGFSKLYDGGRVIEAACWAHARRKFVDLHELHKSPIATQMIERISALYAVEQTIRGRSPDERYGIRQQYSRPLLNAIKSWLEQTLTTLSRKSETAKAISYALRRWDALVRYCDDGRIEIDNNAAERALRCVALGRKNYLFLGSDAGGDSAAAIYSLLGTAKLNGHNLEAYLREVLTRLADHPINRITELLPWNFRPPAATTPLAGDANPQIPA